MSQQYHQPYCFPGRRPPRVELVFQWFNRFRRQLIIYALCRLGVPELAQHCTVPQLIQETRRLARACHPTFTLYMLPMHPGLVLDIFSVPWVETNELLLYDEPQEERLHEEEVYVFFAIKLFSSDVEEPPVRFGLYLTVNLLEQLPLLPDSHPELLFSHIILDMTFGDPFTGLAT